MTSLRKIGGHVRPYLKRTLLWSAYGFIALAILSSLFRALTPMVSQYKPQLERTISKLTGHSVTIEQLETGWYWFQPVVKAKQVIINGKTHPALQIAQIELGISIWSSLLHGRLQPGLLAIEGINLQLVETPLGWSIQGLTLPTTNENTSPDELLALILSHQTIQLKKVTLDVVSASHCNVALLLATRTSPPQPQKTEPRCKETPRHFYLHDLSATLVNGFGTHRLRGEALLKEPDTKLNFGAEFLISPAAPEALSGHVYLKADPFSLPTWINDYLPENLELLHAMIGGEVWGDLSSGQLQGLQSRFNFSHLGWKDKLLNRTGKLVELTGEVNWTKTRNGFELQGKDLYIQDKQGVWPKTDFMLKVNAPASPSEGTPYELFIKNLDVHRILALPLRFPAEIKPLVEMRLTGTLKELQLKQQQAQWSLLTEFIDLGWKAYQTYPQVQHLHGVLHWQGDEGQIALDSPGAKIKWPHYPKLVFPMLNLNLRWNKNAEGTAYQLTHLALEHPHLKLATQGRYLVGTQPDHQLLDLHGRFEILDGVYWLPYLPKTWLKPKLYEWLRHDIHQFDEGVGQFDIQGNLKDFPFDNGPGQFKIETQLTGLDLQYAPHWPRATGITGRLIIDKRRLTAQIQEAMIQSVKLDGITLQIGDLGLNKERLWVHGVAHQAPTQEGWNILLNSPLGKNQSALQDMHWQGLLDLDLQMDVSLSPGNDEILAKGAVQLHKNQLKIQPPGVDLRFKQMDGLLHFDEQGLLSSPLTAQLWKKPVKIDLRSENKPARLTQIHLHSTATIEALFQVFHQQPPSALTGEMPLSAIFTLPSASTEPQTLELESDLTGVKIHFPPFIEKDLNKPMPTRAVLKFQDQGLSLNMNYGTEISLSRSHTGVWVLNSRLPDFAGVLKYDVKKALLFGELTQLKIDPEQFNFGSEDNEELKPAAFPNSDLVVKKLNYKGLDLGQLTLKASKQGAKWVIDTWKLESGVYATSGSADWIQEGKQNKSHLSLSFNTPDISRFLQLWYPNPALESGKAKLEANLYWPNTLLGFSMDEVSGSVKGKITNGRTIGFNRQTESKLGLVKLLSILSLQTIPRRLMLDFSDLSHDGYSFDEFKGEFKLYNGILETESCTIEGPVVLTDLYGRVNLVDQVYDLTARVVPQLTGSLPVVATIAGGPVAGAATWLASKILNKGVQQFTSYSYRITGPWKDPVVEPLKLYRKSH